MSALHEAAGDSLALLASYESLSLARRNYKSCMYADLLACQLWELLRAAGRVNRTAYEDGYDTAAYDVAATILELRRAGAGGEAVAAAVEDMAVLRVMLSLPDAAGALTGDDDGEALPG